MATLNYAFKELSCKIVYYGCGLCGKTTNLEHIHKTVPGKYRGDLVSLATEQDRTLFFDFLPLDLGEVKGFKTKFQLYTVPGQVYYNATRKLVLRGVDGIVFVTDSSRDRFQENLDSLENLKQNMADYGLHLQTGPDDHEGVPWVIQYNKRDLPDVCSIQELEDSLNFGKAPYVEAVAFKGNGVKETLKAISTLVIKRLNREGSDLGGVSKPASQKPAAAAASKHDDEYAAMDEKELEQMEAGKGPAPKKEEPKAAAPAPAPAPAAKKEEPKAATPAPAPAAKKEEPKAAPAAAGPAYPALAISQQCDARWNGMKTGSGSLSITNLAGGGKDEYQLTGMVSFMGIFKRSLSAKLRYRGKDTKGGETYHAFDVVEAGGAPPLTVFVKDGESKLYVNYPGTGGAVAVSPSGMAPLS